MTVIYTPPRPRYIVRENGEPEQGFHSYVEAKLYAEEQQLDMPHNTYDVIDTQGDDQ